MNRRERQLLAAAIEKADEVGMALGHLYAGRGDLRHDLEPILALVARLSALLDLIREPTLSEEVGE